MLCKNIVITCGENGMYLNNIMTHIDNNEQCNLVDVTGSGDIVFSILIFSYLLDKNMVIACRISNFVARRGIKYIGNYSVTVNDIQAYYEENIDFLLYDYEIDKITRLSKKENIVFTNGCFDIIHSAHIQLLQYAKSLGKILVVGLNSDSSIKNIKGEKRPINDECERIELLKNLGFIDYIIVFYDNTPYHILNHLKPDILVKGGDYSEDSIIGKEFTKKICLFDFIQNKSSTKIIEKINLKIN